MLLVPIAVEGWCTLNAFNLWLEGRPAVSCNNRGSSCVCPKIAWLVCSGWLSGLLEQTRFVDVLQRAPFCDISQPSNN
jgi:hypothetical protein